MLGVNNEKCGISVMNFPHPFFLVFSVRQKVEAIFSRNCVGGLLGTIDF